MTVTSGFARTESQKQRSPTSMQIERTPGFTTSDKHFNYYTDRALSFVEQWAQLCSLNQLMTVCWWALFTRSFCMEYVLCDELWVFFFKKKGPRWSTVTQQQCLQNKRWISKRKEVQESGDHMVRIETMRLQRTSQ